MDDSVVITLFRHGLTEANKRKEYLGWTDSPLCSSNSQQHPFLYDLYFSSDLNRCLTTLKNYFPNKKTNILCELREMNFGEFEGKTYEQLKDRADYQDWLSNPFKIAPTNGETFEIFVSRVEAGWEKIKESIQYNQAQKVLIMAHGGVIRYLLTKYAPFKSEFWDWSVSHEIGFEFTFNRESLRRGDRCTLLREVPLTASEHG